MPDISKLPELATIFGVSVHVLIGEKSKLINAVINNEIKEYVDNNEVAIEELEEHIPILKPDQVKTFAEKIDFTKADDITTFLPYLDNETTVFLAQKKIENGESILSLLPFLDDEAITKFAQQKLESGESMNSFLPFLNEKVLKQIVLRTIK